MNAARTVPAAPISTVPTAARVPMIGALRALLLGEAAAALALAIFLSAAAAAMPGVLGGDPGRAAEETLRFAAGGATLFAIFAALASLGARKRRGWSWTLAAILQVVLAIGTGVAVMTSQWHPLFLAGFGFAALVMLVLSSTSVRGALGQE